MILINEKTKDKMYINSSKINEIKFFEKGLFYTTFIIRNILFSLDNGYRFEMFPLEIDILRRLGLEEFKKYLPPLNLKSDDLDIFMQEISKRRFEFLKVVDEIESEVDSVFNKIATGGEETIIKLDYLRFKRCL